jgi:aconitate hydratase
MGLNVAQKLIDGHLVDGEMTAGSEIGLRVDQTLTQDATGTMVMLELEALGLGRARTQVSVQYVDHNLLQADERNMADHLFLRSACQRFGLWYSKPGNGVSHPVHMQRFGVPGASLTGSDSHTCAAGSLGMLAVGVGGLEVAMAIAGQPLYLTMPPIWGVRLTGELPPWVSAKDVILEMLRRHGVDGGTGKIIEYHGPGLACLTAMDRHVIANMGAELGATATVFPADDMVRAFLRTQSRTVELVKAPSIGSLPDFDPLPESLELPVAIKVGDDVSTDEILPAGARVLPYRSNIAKLAEFAFGQPDQDRPGRRADPVAR